MCENKYLFINYLYINTSSIRNLLLSQKINVCCTGEREKKIRLIQVERRFGMF